MSGLVGYLTRRMDGLYGSRGTAYDYVTAGNGIFLEAQNQYLAARVKVAGGLVRGLAPINEQIVFRHGRIPGRLWELTLNALLAADRQREHYIGFRWDGSEYRLYHPHQTTGAAHIEYLIGDSIVMDLHSHASMKAFFSETDNRDEQGFRLYGVIGHLNERPQFTIRLGVYGYFTRIPWGHVFDGPQPVDIDELKEGAEA